MITPRPLDNIVKFKQAPWIQIKGIQHFTNSNKLTDSGHVAIKCSNAFSHGLAQNGSLLNWPQSKLFSLLCLTFWRFHPTFPGNTAFTSRTNIYSVDFRLDLGIRLYSSLLTARKKQIKNTCGGQHAKLLIFPDIDSLNN